VSGDDLTLIGQKQPVVFESPLQTFENPIGTERDEIAKMFDEARADLTPPKTAAEVWERFCGRQDALKLDDLKGAIERFRDQPIPRFSDPEVQAAIREQAVTGRAFSAAFADELNGRNAGKTPAEYLHEAEVVQRQQDALDRAAAQLARFIEPTATEFAELRRVLADEARTLAATSGRTYESALEHVADLLQRLTVVRPETPWEDLRAHVERIARDLQPLRPPPKFKVLEPGDDWRPMPNGATRRAPDPVTPALPKRQRPRNKYDSRPPGKR
jgi:hypothetical protein